MNIIVIVLTAIVVALCIAIYMQVKASHEQAEEGQRLLNDYQHRVDEQQKLLEDYRSLEKNFNNVGEGYEQALLAFDKMEEEKQRLNSANAKLQQLADNLTKANTNLSQQLVAMQDKAKTLSEEASGHLLNIIRETATLDATGTAANIKQQAISLMELLKPTAPEGQPQA